MASTAILRSTIRGIPGRQGSLPGQFARFTLLFLAAMLLAGAWAVSAGAQECACTPCHGTLEEVHGDYNHTAAPGRSAVAIFADYSHDDAAWNRPSPQFGLVVDCTLCHNTDLPAVHGNDCATCHPTPYDTLETWGKGCQQGGCHAAYHEDAAKAHLPFENSSDPANDCSICHGWWEVQQTNCLNCHAAFVPDDVSPPVTTSDTKAAYDGPAVIRFSITDNGKVGVGRTFYRLDDGPVSAAGNYVQVDTPGPHQLEFWSMDQSGNQELAANLVFFNVDLDATPPVTTSNAQALYYQGATITLSATDGSTQGVKATYYQLNGGAVQTGTTVVIPATTGSIDHALSFWSEDWAGNVESANVVNFTVVSGRGTLRLVWGGSEISGSPCVADPEASAAWTVRRDSWSGPLVASGADSCPNWSGVDDLAVAVSSTAKYFVSVDWYDSYGGYDDNTLFSNISVTTPGQIVRLSY